ncbi:unnamed protein product, partial [Iphiclides podalirius]
MRLWRESQRASPMRWWSGSRVRNAALSFATPLLAAPWDPVGTLRVTYGNTGTREPLPELENAAAPFLEDSTNVDCEVEPQLLLTCSAISLLRRKFKQTPLTGYTFLCRF